jgi:prepilin-type N-terminal cleavage/methylation domain-containing protein
VIDRLTNRDAGFSLIELVIVLTVTGLVLALSAVPFGAYMDDLALRGAVDNIAGRLLQARESAVGTRAAQVVKFEAGYLGTDYRLEIGGAIAGGWSLPRRVSYAWLPGTINTATMTADGRCSASGLVVLENTRGHRDTVSILSSGLILTQ